MRNERRAKGRKVVPRLRSLTGATRDAVAATRILDVSCEKAVATLRRKCPDAFPAAPLGAGEVAPPVTLNPARARSLYRIAFAEASGVESAQPEQVVWVNAENELLVRLARIRVAFRDGFVLVGIPVFTEQSGDAEVVVSFAVGHPNASIGLVMATEATPRGPPLIVERWGDQITAAAWLALIKVASAIAATAGVDDHHQALLPAALMADAKGITIRPQARHAIDRSKW